GLERILATEKYLTKSFQTCTIGCRRTGLSDYADRILKGLCIVCTSSKCLPDSRFSAVIVWLRSWAESAFSQFGKTSAACKCPAWKFSAHAGRWQRRL